MTIQNVTIVIYLIEVGRGTRCTHLHTFHKLYYGTHIFGEFKQFGVVQVQGKNQKPKRKSNNKYFHKLRKQTSHQQKKAKKHLVI